MSSTGRTPQTRSQTKKIATTRVSSAAGKAGAVLDLIWDPILLVTSGTVAILAAAAYVFAKHHKKVLNVPKLPAISDRLVYTLQQQTFSLIPLVICLAHVMLTRLVTKARNPLSGNEKLVDKSIRILNNTLEQFILSAFNQLILVTFLPADYLYVIPFLVYTFTFARFAFIIGYNIDPTYRSFGFLLTFLPSFAALVINVLYMIGWSKLISLP